MDWSETTFAIFATICAMLLIAIWIILHYVKKTVRYVTSPITSRRRTRK